MRCACTPAGRKSRRRHGPAAPSRLAIMLVALLVPSGCAAQGPHTRSSPPGADRLVVLPVYTDGPLSGFPVSQRNALTAAHSFTRWRWGAVVQGLPMTALLPKDVKLPPLERDWVVLCATRDRFKPNTIDPHVHLRAGDRVIVGGFRRPDRSIDPEVHAAAEPEIVEGHVLHDAPPSDEPAVVRLDVPPGEYYGFSGGPAAIVDSDAAVRVWGIAVGEEQIRGFWPPWRRRTILYVARLCPREVKRIQGMMKLNPLEATRYETRARGQAERVEPEEAWSR